MSVEVQVSRAADAEGRAGERHRLAAAAPRIADNTGHAGRAQPPGGSWPPRPEGWRSAGSLDEPYSHEWATHHHRGEPWAPSAGPEGHSLTL